jgi:hypothetical protein
LTEEEPIQYRDLSILFMIVTTSRKAHGVMNTAPRLCAPSRPFLDSQWLRSVEKTERDLAG